MFQLEDLKLKNFSYKKTICRVLILFFISLILIGGVLYFDCIKNSIGSTLCGTFFGISLPYFISSIVDLEDNKSWKASQRRLYRARLIHKETKIRISFAYLFRIKIDGKYFLVLNSKSGKYQPVGGAYKLKTEEIQYLSENISVEDDDKIPIDDTTKGDYRLYVKNKDLRKFVKRFDKTQYREGVDNLGREFKEELFSTNILDQNRFGDLKYKYCGRHMTDVQFSSYFDCYELLLADIVEVKLNDEQEQLFRNLMEKSDQRYMFAPFEEIRTAGVKFGTNDLKDVIANHSPKILGENSDKLINRNKHIEMITVSFNS